MKRLVLLSVAVVLLNDIHAQPPTPNPVSHIYAVGGMAEFREFLRTASGGELVFCEDFKDLPLTTATNALLVVAPRYAKGKSVVEPLDEDALELLEQAAKRGNRLYFENVRSENMRSQALIGLATFGMRPVRCRQKIVETEEGMLQALKGAYFPAARCVAGKVKQRPKAVASVSDAIGVNKVFVPAQERSPVVVLSADGRRASALIRLSDFDVHTMRPYAQWREFYVKLFAPLLGAEEAMVKAAFEKCFPNPVGAAGVRPNEEVVKRALRWHERSGLLFAPDGSKGTREALFCHDFHWRSALRTDVNFMTGALFARAGKIYGRDDWVRIGRNLADNMLSRGNQTDDGYFRWFDRESPGHGAHKVYATDHGRATLAAVNLYEATGERKYLEAARKAADAFLRWQSEDGLVAVDFDLRGKQIPVKGHSENPVCYYENVPALFKLAKITGERKYSDAALRCVKTMSVKFPNFNLGNGAFYSANSVYGRYLLMAASAQLATDEDFSATINGVLDFYAKNQHAKGGIQEIQIRMVAHEEAGVGIGDGSDHIADLLYCNNFSFAALSLLMKLPRQRKCGIDMAKARQIYGKLRDFLARVQIASDDERLDGAWMRAYDMDIDEWHGLNKDLGWGPYCIESGWTTGTIPAVFLFDGREESYF